MEMKPLTIVVAVADGGVIGAKNGLPWHIPEDLRFFKETTVGHAIIVGRKTYASVGRPLPKRRNIVVSRTVTTIEGCEVVSTVDEAIRIARDTDEDPRVIGGAEIYALALPQVTRILITEIHRKVEGDAFFPELDRSEWRETARRRGTEAPDIEFVTLERIS